MTLTKESVVDLNRGSSSNFRHVDGVRKSRVRKRFVRSLTQSRRMSKLDSDGCGRERKTKRGQEEGLNRGGKREQWEGLNRE